MIDDEELVPLFGAVGDEKADLDSESDSSDGSSAKSSNGGSSSEAESEGEETAGEYTFQKKENKTPPAKSSAKPSTALTDYEELLMHKHGDLENVIRIFRVTKEKAKMDNPSGPPHINFFCVKDVYENLGLQNPRLGKDFSDTKRHFKCKVSGEKRIGLPTRFIENMLNTIKKSSKNKKIIRDLFKKSPVPYDVPRSSKRKLKDPEIPKAKKPKTSESKKGSGSKNSSQVDQEFESLHGMLPLAYKILPIDDKRDMCLTMKKSLMRGVEKSC